MIVLDTNVISELMRAQPDAAVLAWVSGQPRATLFTTSINHAEILYGVGALPPGRRRAALADSAAAARYAEIVISRCAAGTPIDAFDGLIAATAWVAGARVATRDISGFENCGVTLINPWEVA